MAIQMKKSCSTNCAEFGKLPDGQTVHLFTLENSQGMVAKISTYGAVLTELHVPDRNGKLDNVVLGFDNLDQYLQKHPHFGGTIGRYANRIANATFNVDGKDYALAANNGPNTLHGGKESWEKRLWKAESGQSSLSAWVELSYISPDGEEGFPGKVEVVVTYELTAGNSLVIKYQAVTDKATPISLTNHSYFNLSGAGNGDILDHTVQMQASHYLPVDATQIPTGEIASVIDTPFDFTQPHKIGERIAQTGKGYDHNFVINLTDRNSDIATVYDESSGRRMTVRTTYPGVQLYTGNSLDGTITGNGGNYPKNSALCIETQQFPDAMHHANFPNCILRPGDQLTSVTSYTFSV